MEAHFINKIIYRSCLGLTAGLIFLSCGSQKKIVRNEAGFYPDLVGRYQDAKRSEFLMLNADKTFYYIKNPAKNSDVVVPRCDTMAKGFWRVQEQFVVLQNPDDFNRLNYIIIDSTIKSNDSVYFKIILPEDDAFHYNRFRYSIFTSPVIGSTIESDNSVFVIPRSVWGNVSFSVLIQNLTPVSDEGKKSYQRLYFKVFDDYKPKSSNSNSFTISISNFSQCFYEAMDIEGEVLGLGNKRLYWKGSSFVKVNL